MIYTEKRKFQDKKVLNFTNSKCAISIKKINIYRFLKWVPPSPKRINLQDRTGRLVTIHNLAYHTLIPTLTGLPGWTHPYVLFILEAYSLMLNRGGSQNFPNLNFLHIFVALLWDAQFLKGIRLKAFQYEIRAIFTESLIPYTRLLFNTVVLVYGSNETHIIMHNLKM